MSIKIAINGFGRIGRCIFRALFEGGYNKHITLVAINDLGKAEFNAHLAQFDSVHGRFPYHLNLTGNTLSVENQSIQMLSVSNPADLPWESLEVDVVLECTGRFTDRAAAEQHIRAGCKKVIISAPAKHVDCTVVYGVNHKNITRHQVISNASCTTNCLTPMVKIFNDALGIHNGSMTTIHAYTNDQAIHDTYHSDIYRARGAAQSMIPTSTGAAEAVALVLPEMAGKLTGMAVRVPTANVSLVDFTFIAKRSVTVEAVNQLVKAAALKSNGILTFNELPLVSVDFNHQSASCNFDATQTQVNGPLVKVMAWYDNEWGFSHRMLDNSLAIMQKQLSSNIAA